MCLEALRGISAVTQAIPLVLNAVLEGSHIKQMCDIKEMKCCPMLSARPELFHLLFLFFGAAVGKFGN